MPAWKSRMTESELNLHFPTRRNRGIRTEKANYYVCTAKSFELQMKASKTY